MLVSSSVFFLLHLFPATPLRGRLIAFAGEGPYSGVFSLLSIIALWWLVRAFEATPFGGNFWAEPAWWLWLEAAIVLFALMLIVGGLLTPNPSAPGGGKLIGQQDLTHGVFAVTRHPVMWGIAIWAIAHAISEATVRGFVFFGTFAATALIGSWLQQRRKKAEIPAWAGFEARTSYLPFLAIIQGRAKLSLKAIGWWRIAVAVILWAAILHFHDRLFGVQPLPFLN